MPFHGVTYGLKDHQHTAQGIALGGNGIGCMRPVRAKASFDVTAFALFRAHSLTASQTQGDTLGYALTALSGHKITFIE